MAADFAMMGVQIDPDIREPEGDDAFEVWQENWDIILAFLTLETQWNVLAGPAGLIWIGLNYVAVDVVLRRLKSPDDVFDGLRIMEAAALEVLSKERAS